MFGGLAVPFRRRPVITKWLEERGMSIEIKRRVHVRAQEQISAKIVELETV